MQDLLAFSARGGIDHGVRYAAALARLLDARVDALVVCEPVTEVVALTQPTAAGLLIAWQQDQLARARAGREPFATFTRAESVAGEWLVAEAPVGDAVADAGTWHDLVVLGAQRDQPWGDAGAIGRLVLAANLPVVVVPEAHAAPPAFDVVAVAWNGSLQATRALHAALPLLRRAGRIVLLAGTRSMSFDTMIEHPPFDPEAHLRAHGVRHETCVLDHPDERSGEELLARAADMGAGLLVMGAWGRTRASELLLGGATRHVLQKAKLPLFLRH